MTASNFKIALLAIALSPFILNAELRDELYEDEEDVAYTDDRNDENENGLYYEEAEDDDLADASSDSDESYSDRADQNAGCRSPYHRMHFGVRHTEARGVGYKDGYTTLEGFGIYDNNPNFMPFLDLRGHVFNNGKLAGNFGIGGRSVLSGINHILGAYLYYDVRQENHSFTINQLSPGIELLGKRMEYRMNGYFPVGGHHSHKYGYEFSRFDGNNIRLRQKQKFALKGGDAEVGVHLTQSTKWDLYTGAGPYFFAAGGAHGWGGKVRLLGRFKEYISLEASYSYDRMFRNVVQGTIGFNYAFGKKLSRRDRNCPQNNDLMLSRAAFAPYRFEIPVVKKVRKNIRAINPATGLPWQVWFVNNTSSSAGTYQSPFPTLAQAETASSPNDMIYVFPGDGTTTGMDAGITLQNGQKLFGSGIAHKIRTTKGKIVIPAFSSTAPMLTSGANIVTLASGNEVSGLNLVDTAGGIAISGSTGTNGAYIHDNISSGSSYNGINIFGYGNIVIKNNQFAGSSTNAGQAIRLTVDPNQNMNVTASNNQISGFTFGIGMNLSSNSTTNCNILYNNISTLNAGSSTGIFFGILGTATSATGTGAIIGNQVSSQSSTAIQLLSRGSTPGSLIQVLVANNTVQTGATPGSIGLFAQSQANGTLCTSIVDNQITLQNASATDGINISTIGNGIVNIDNISGNTAPVFNVSGNVNLVAPGTCSR